jgi:hypothetical protein
MRLAVFFLITIHVFAGAPESASAQSSDGFGLPRAFTSDIALELSPENPGPGETVTIAARSLLLDLDALTLAWFKDGKALEQGAGRTSISLTAPPLGNSTEISLLVLENGTERARDNAIIRPVEIDLLWEADSFTPPFFRGRSLPSAGTQFRFEAQPHFIRADGSRVSNADIIFTWRRNGYVIQNVSGRGAARAVIDAPALFGANTISLEARSADGMFRGEESANLPAREPELILYEDHPLFGVMYHRALSSDVSLPGEEISLVAVPYFAEAAHSYDSALLWEWKVNGNNIENDPDRPNEITIDARGSSGIARIDLALSHATNLFLDSERSWKLSLFGESNQNFFNAPLFESEEGL